jgi:hypothetical protein
MSTRSNIAVQNEDGTISMIYCHFDGYPSNNGSILQEDYQDVEKIKKLIALGDMSSLGVNSGSCTFYSRDRGEAFSGVKPRVFNNEEVFMLKGKDVFQSYLYYFRDNEWWMFSDYHPLCQDGLVKLETVLAQEDPNG